LWSAKTVSFDVLGHRYNLNPSWRRSVGHGHCKVQVRLKGKKTESAEKDMKNGDEVQYGFDEDFAKIEEIISAR